MIRGQSDKLFPSLVKLAQWYENQLIVTTDYLKVALKHFGIKRLTINTLQKASEYQLYATALNRPGDLVPYRIRLEVKQEFGSVPITSVKQDRRSKLELVDKIQEEDHKFNFDKRLTGKELKEKFSMFDEPVDSNNTSKPSQPVIPMSSMAKFYESKIDTFAKLAKSIMIISDCKKLELPWEETMNAAKHSQLHVDYHVDIESNGFKNIKEATLRLSEGFGPTTYGFVKRTNGKNRSHLRVVK